MRPDMDRLRSITGGIAALNRAADWIQLSAVVGPAIDIAVRTSIQTTPHTDLELLETEVLWRTESDLDRSLNRSLTCALDASASTAHRAQAALLCAIVADNICRFTDLERLNDIATKLAPSTVDAQANLLSVRLIYESVRGSLDQARECGAQLVTLEREAGSVCGLARALRFSCYAHRMPGAVDVALAASNEALELAERHNLVGEAASAADVILSIHLEQKHLPAARSWIVRSEKLASRVGARYARVSLAINQATHALLLGDSADAMRFIEPHAKNHLQDPVIRQRMFCLSILARIFVARADLGCLADLTPSLKSALDLRRSTGAHDFQLASCAYALEALGNRRALSGVGGRCRPGPPNTVKTRFLSLSVDEIERALQTSSSSSYESLALKL